MGCAASKLDSEDTVRRCKDRRRLMKEAVYARHHLAAAHVDYCRSLRLTGSALSLFAAGEPLSVSDQTPAVFLHPPPPEQSPINLIPPSPAPSSVHPPPPMSPSVASTKSKQQIPIIPESKNSNRRRKSQPRPKLPHILSESSSPMSERSNFYPGAYQNSTYSATPSHASSVWNWENFYPPSPPDSEFFDKKAHERNQKQYLDNRFNDEDTETERSEYDFFHTEKKKKKQVKSVSNTVEEEEETEREEVQCSEWEDHDHYSTTSSSEEEEDEDRESISEIGTHSEFESTVRSDSMSRRNHQHHQQQQQPSPMPQEYGGIGEKVDDASSYRGGREIADMKMVVRHRDLKEIVDAIKENFDKAAASGDQVSQMLELGRAQLDRSFSQLKKTVIHSSSVLSNLSSTWTSKPPLAVKYRLDTTALDQTNSPKSLCSTLDRLLAWEKKLYEEIKARESVKIEHEKKLSQLQSQEYKGEDEVKLDKTKASITRLQSLIIVTSQAVTTTSTAIIRLRDTDLVPQLVELCHGFMYMWKSMHQFHETQNSIVQQVRGLINRLGKGESTSELHRQATRDLESTVSSWHSSFSRLIKFQRDFIQSVHAWFKLTLLPVCHEDAAANQLKEPLDAFAFCDEWKLALDRVPDTVASEAIKSFINVVHVISAKQADEHKIKKRTESASKELEKKASSVRNLERKYYQSYSMVGVDSGPHNQNILDARDPLSDKKSELAACQRRVEEEMVKHSKAIDVTRAMTLNNLQTGLPGVFQALTSFSALFMESLQTVCTRSYSIK
ncbi:hypothetical protein AALP_AA5G258900 [Arabis alpina]|uniref:DUF632 domain-containing protein n=1 Tax=Arabis alpina TaxID=50452 RepID=A0A087GZE0_ARAAL|nr:hypothetical protein AALP_AA5G258900 [Arabis alpina]